MESEKCEYMYVHEDTVQKVINDMPEEEKLYDFARTLIKNIKNNRPLLSS